MSSPRVLLVDDDPAIRTSIGEALTDARLDVSVAETGEAALGMVGELRPALVISDVRMPGMDGLMLLDELRTRGCGADVILMTAFDDMPTVASAMRGGAVEFLVKPLDLDQLIESVVRVLQDRAVRKRESHNGTGDASPSGTLVGRTPEMIAVYKRVGQAATSGATVLIRGESGTGKELVARAIHDLSAHAREPFVAINCASLPETLLESELFGHVRGAFTGAVTNRRGCFAIAGRGTVFLDEIGDTSPEFQSKLLRVLQNREYQPVGAERTENTEARVVAATHRPLERMLAAGTFREDLYYRLRVVDIALPPLRERAADIPLLANHLVDRACASLGLPPATLSRDAMRAIESHGWPGNVRELENCLIRGVVLAAGKVIHVEHLSIASPTSDATPELVTLERSEAEYITRVLTAVRGNKSRAAEILGVSRPRLSRLLRKHAIQ